MSEVAIRIENLSKRYRIGQYIGYDTLRESLTSAVSATFRRRSGKAAKAEPGNLDSDHIWALKNISFEVKQGEALGVIGRNGAGKTTLLKILSNITTPTGGHAELHGKVGSLLEVGTGFHAELTGRENIYMNGAILGMKKREIEQRFGEIVEFSGVKKFLDTPIKRYSSGMLVRLAFSVAAHLQPEILLVDEVLAVGDAEFQKKCLGKMEDVTQEGRTVLLVSHNMAAVKGLCQRTILLDGGEIVKDGPTQEVVRQYLGSGSGTSAERKWDDIKTAPGKDVVRLHAVRAKNKKGEVTSEFNIQEPIYVEMEYWVLQEGVALNDFFRFYDESGTFLFASYNNIEPTWGNRRRPAGLYRSACTVPGNFLNEGNIVIWAAVATLPHTLQALETDAITFHVYDPGSGGVRGNYVGPWSGGVIRPMLEWKTEHVASL